MAKSFAEAIVLATGKFPAGATPIDHLDRDLEVDLNSAERVAIETNWRADRSKKAEWANHKMQSLEGWVVFDGRLELSTVTNLYRTYIGTQSDAYLQRFGLDACGKPLGVTAGVITADNQLLSYSTGKRTYLPNRLVEFNVRDPGRTVTRMLTETTPLQEREISRQALFCLGLVFSFEPLMRFDAIFGLRSPITSFELQKRNRAKDCMVFSSLERFGANPEPRELTHPEAPAHSRDRVAAFMAINFVNGVTEYGSPFVESDRFFGEYSGPKRQQTTGK